MKKCWVFSNREFNAIMERNNINDYNIPEDYAFISIGDPGYNEDDRSIGLFHWFSKNSDRVINLDFYDITDYSLPGSSVFGMTDSQALELYKFIEKNKGKNFFIHCAAGVSRSQGVAKYILDTYPEFYSWEESIRKDNPCEFPNFHVVSLLKHIYFNENINNS